MDNFARSGINMFVAQTLNRAHDQRKNENWLAERLKDPGSAFLPVWGERVFVTEGEEPRAGLLSMTEIEGYLQSSACPVVFLGEEGGRAFFAAGLTGNGAGPPELAAEGVFLDLRAVAPLLSKRDGALLAYAKTILYWHGRNRFCGACGSPNESAEGGHVRVCTSKDCGLQHFPRTDPAIIVLVRSDDSCLLGRQPIWPERFYSTVAGFVEPGESAEAAVMREVFEETGIMVKEVYYHSSQPWPFPCSLMLGFHAYADGGQQFRLQDELEDARWFTRSGLREAVEAGQVRLPSLISIAFHLVESWYDEDSPAPLRELASAPGRTR